MPNINVTKRDGELTPLDYNKIHFILEESTKGLSGVSVSDIELNASLQFNPEIKTTDIHAILIRSAVDLISVDTPNYEIVAARLTNYNLRKEVFDGYVTPPLGDVIRKNVSISVYDSALVENYTSDEIDHLDSHIDHDRDDLFKSAGIQQCIDKYLIQDRQSGEIYETPQYMYMCIAMTLFSSYPDHTRMMYVVGYYDEISQFNINLPTPILCGVRTPLRQYSSCVLIDVDDTIDSIIQADSYVKKYTSQRAGIGINAGRIRAIGSKVRGGEVVHTGVIPFLKCFETSVRSCTQGGVRGGSATVYFPFWHKEIEDIIVLKNNKGTDENRVRNMDYNIQVNKLFFQRVISGADITLFSPHEVPEVYEHFGDDQFEALYVAAEQDPTLSSIKINARTLFVDMIRERIETGRLYLMNIDHCNSHSSFTVPIRQSNLCCEITLPTEPSQTYDDPESEVALCILSAINLGNIDVNNMHAQMKKRCDLAVRALDSVIDLQEYPIVPAKTATLNRRSLGVGYIGMAHFIAKNKMFFGDADSVRLMDEVTELFQYHLIETSIELAKEHGPCPLYLETKYGQGILPIDTYSKSVDEVCDRPLSLDWEKLRRDVLEFGIRNSTLSCQMPSESSSVTSNETNGIEAPRAAVIHKKSKKGILKMVLPEYRRLKDYYVFAWDEKYTNTGYINISAVIQKYFDQGMSVNEYYVASRYPNGELPVKDVMRNIIYGHKMGMKTFYYLNSDDGKVDLPSVGDDNSKQDELDMGSDCEGGACSI